jgi:hypothetical protein
MAFMNPFRRFGGEHEAKIVDNLVPTQGTKGGAGSSVYNLKMVCSCQFEVLCRTMEEAESWKRQHLGTHGMPVEGRVEAVNG